MGRIYPRINTLFAGLISIRAESCLKVSVPLGDRFAESRSVFFTVPFPVAMSPRIFLSPKNGGSPVIPLTTPGNGAKRPTD